MSKLQVRPLMSLVEKAKKAAAYRAVDEHLSSNAKVVGIGSGSTVVYVAERIGQLASKDFICIPTGFQSKQLIIDNGLNLGSIEQHPVLDVAFDGADEVDPSRNLIKGGGACLFQEKLVANAAAKFVIVADYRKKSDTYLGQQWRQGVPIEIVPLAYSTVARQLKELGAKTVTLRQGGSAKAGPVITDNNNFLIDADFGLIEEPEELHYKLKQLVGVVDTGLFTRMADAVYFGEQDGDVSSL